MRKITVGKHELTINQGNKIIFPDIAVTKNDLIDYYFHIAPYILPFLKNRPLTIQRFPEGLSHEGFIQQHAFEHTPNWFKSIELAKKSGGTMRHLLCENLESLIYLVNQGMITLHRWLSTIRYPELPDIMVIDIDPAAHDFAMVCFGAKLIKDMFQDMSITAFVMTTGSRGLHVVIPIKPKLTFQQIRDFLHQHLQALIDKDPDKFTLEIRKEKREGRIFLDIMRNTYGQTAVAPYAVRAYPNAPIATPLEWNELDDEHLTSQSFNIKNILQRLQPSIIPWQNYQEYHHQTIPY